LETFVLVLTGCPAHDGLTKTSYVILRTLASRLLLALVVKVEPMRGVWYATTLYLTPCTTYPTAVLTSMVVKEL
jgi:hypothetical protein